MNKVALSQEEEPDVPRPTTDVEPPISSIVLSLATTKLLAESGALAQTARRGQKYLMDPPSDPKKRATRSVTSAAATGRMTLHRSSPLPTSVPATSTSSAGSRSSAIKALIPRAPSLRLLDLKRRRQEDHAEDPVSKRRKLFSRA